MPSTTFRPCDSFRGVSILFCQQGGSGNIILNRSKGVAMAGTKNTLVRSFAISAMLVASFFVVRGVEVLFRLPLSQFGIVPRTVHGLLGIIFSPFLHENLNHLLANAIPF